MYYSNYETLITANYQKQKVIINTFTKMEAMYEKIGVAKRYVHQMNYEMNFN